MCTVNNNIKLLHKIQYNYYFKNFFALRRVLRRLRSCVQSLFQPFVRRPTGCPSALPRHRVPPGLPPLPPDTPVTCLRSSLGGGGLTLFIVFPFRPTVTPPFPPLWCVPAAPATGGGISSVTFRWCDRLGACIEISIKKKNTPGRHIDWD